MDGIKRKLPSAPAPIKMSEPKPAYSKSGPFKARKEELYITQEELSRMQKHEQDFRRGRIAKKIAWIFLLGLLLGAISYASYFLIKAYSISKKINIEKPAQETLAQQMRSLISPVSPTSTAPLKGESEGRINILLLGAAGEKNPGRNLTDTIIIMSIDTKNKKVALLSLPRDLYVQVPVRTEIGNHQSETGLYMKINGLYPYGLNNNIGIDPILKTVENVTGLNINYFIIANYDGFEKIIDNIGGINLTVERDIYDTQYPGPNYSYETFEIKKGFHTLDGATALKYARERHDDPEGDFGRAKRQQQVLQSIKNKIFSARTFLDVFRLNDVLNTVGDNIKTNITFEELERFLNLSKELDTQNVNSVVVDAWKPESLLKVSHVMTGSVRMFVLVPRVGNYSEIREAASYIFDRNATEKRKEEITREDASIAIVDRSGDNTLAQKIRSLLSERLSHPTVKMYTDNEERNDTIIIDNAAGKKIYTLDELIKKLPATISGDKSQSTENIKEDLVIVLGKDLSETYKYEEDSINDFSKAQDDQDNPAFPL